MQFGINQHSNFSKILLVLEIFTSADLSQIALKIVITYTFQIFWYIIIFVFTFLNYY